MRCQDRGTALILTAPTTSFARSTDKAGKEIEVYQRYGLGHTRACLL